MTFNLPEILAPLSPEQFFAEYFGKNFCHVKGGRGRFADLLPWAALNQILDHARIDYPRIRLVKGAQLVPPEAFLKYEQSRRDPKVFLPRLQAVALTSHLRQGATLVLDNIEELHRPVMDLAANLQQAFRERVQVNLYAGWHTSNAFDLHWDDHDVIVLQVSGRKEWSIYGPSRLYPIRQDVQPNVKAPETPVWNGMLEDGDLLYIPRGWWHVAVPLAEPTLHLSFGVYNSTGLDLLDWLAKQLRASDLFRMDLPLRAGEAERRAHLSRLRDELIAAWDQGDLLARYYRHGDGMAEPLQLFGLPWGAMANVLPPSDDARVRLTVTRPLNFTPDAERRAVEFWANGKKWKFPEVLIPILQTLEGKPSCSVRELCKAVEGSLDRVTVRGFLERILAHGLAALVDP